MLELDDSNLKLELSTYLELLWMYHSHQWYYLPFFSWILDKGDRLQGPCTLEKPNRGKTNNSVHWSFDLKMT